MESALSLASKLTKLVSWFHRLCKVLPQSLLLIVYNTKLLPVIDYACSIWGNSTSKIYT